MESTRIRLTIDKRKIAWLKFVLESYEGVALLKTIDQTSGRVLLLVGRGMEDEAAVLLRAIDREIGVVAGLSDPLPVASGQVKR